MGIVKKCIFFFTSHNDNIRKKLRNHLVQESQDANEVGGWQNWEVF